MMKEEGEEQLELIKKKMSRRNLHLKTAENERLKCAKIKKNTK
jgi:hypothetical protein